MPSDKQRGLSVELLLLFYLFVFLIIVIIIIVIIIVRKKERNIKEMKGIMKGRKKERQNYSVERYTYNN